MKAHQATTPLILGLVMVVTASAQEPIEVGSLPQEASGVGTNARDRLAILKEEVRGARADFDRAYGKQPKAEVSALWQAYLEISRSNYDEALEIAAKAAGSDKAFAALDWIVSNPQNLHQSCGHEAIGLLLRNHAADPRLGSACWIIGCFGDVSHEPTSELLRVVAAKNPDRATRGQALLSLSRLTYTRAQVAERWKNEEDLRPSTARPSGSARL